MALDDHTVQEQLTPEERRRFLRAFADRMLMKISKMDDPEDMPGVEKAVRVAAVIERLYSRCDRSESHAPDPRKLEAERATNETEAIKARVSLAKTLEWGDMRRRDLGQWWDAAQTVIQDQIQTGTPPLMPAEQPDADAPEHSAPVSDKAAPPSAPKVEYVDYTEYIRKARAHLGLKNMPEAALAGPARKPPPPS